jgi:2-(1,2-epoxy-1,2-dihydrophenyl)acetyl-CoA isomerase
MSTVTRGQSATCVSLAFDDGVAHIQLDRPDAANAVDLDLARGLRTAVDRAGADDDVRAVLVTGAGQRFCGGGDVASFAAAADPSSYLLELATEADLAVQSLAAIAKPVVAAVHGAVAGAGLGIMLSCDLVVAEPSTKFVFAYPAIGLSPDCGVSWLLPRAVGQQRALSFALNGAPLPARAALEWGMVTELADDPLARGRDLARSLSSGAVAALGETRRLLRSAWGLERSAAGALEAQTISVRAGTADAQALISRFLARSARPSARQGQRQGDPRVHR